MSIGSDLRSAADLLARTKILEASAVGQLRAALSSVPVVFTWLATLALAMICGHLL